MPLFFSFHSQDAKPPLVRPLLLQGGKFKRKKPRELREGEGEEKSQRTLTVVKSRLTQTRLKGRKKEHFALSLCACMYTSLLNYTSSNVLPF